MTDSPADIFIPAMMFGIAAGKRNLKKVVTLLPLCRSNNSTKVFGVDLSPSRVLLMMGNSAIMTLMMIMLFISNPNHRTINGATATTGTVCKRMAYGYKLRSSILLKLITVATVIPITMAIT